MLFHCGVVDPLMNLSRELSQLISDSQIFSCVLLLFVVTSQHQTSDRSAFHRHDQCDSLYFGIKSLTFW